MTLPDELAKLDAADTLRRMFCHMMEDWHAEDAALQVAEFDRLFTAVCLAVARAERERCAVAVADVLLYADADLAIRALPDPDWGVTP